MKFYLLKIVLAKTKVMMSIPAAQIKKKIARWSSLAIGPKAMVIHPTNSKDRPINAQTLIDLLIYKTLQLIRNNASNLSTT